MTAGTTPDAAAAGRVLGTWVLIDGELAAAVPALVDDSTAAAEGIHCEMSHGDHLAAVAADEALGERDARALAASDLAVVARDVDAGLLGVICASTGTIDQAGLPLPVHVDERTIFVHHLWSHPDARNRGLARAMLSDLVRAAMERGYGRLRAYTTDGNRTVRRIVTEFGWGLPGHVLHTSWGEHHHWITVGPEPLFAPPPDVSGPGIFVHVVDRPESLRYAADLAALIGELADAGARVVLGGSGAAAEEIVALVPSLRPLVVGVADSDRRRHGQRFEPTGHEIVPTGSWSEGGGTHLLYASHAYQDEMHDAHRAAGPAGTFGIRLHPRVEVVPVRDHG